ncbi:MAG: HD domain-containing protein, partial [Candidatus Zixiibacteriota bacterium]
MLDQEQVKARVSELLRDSHLKQLLSDELRALQADRPDELDRDRFNTCVAIQLVRELQRELLADETWQDNERSDQSGCTPGETEFDRILDGLMVAVQHDLLVSHLQMVRVLGGAIAARDTGTSEHNARVTIYATRLGELCELTTERMQALIKGAFLHDIGKIGIRDNILLKHTGLTEPERRIMQSHPEMGARLLKGIPWLEDALDGVRHHHERWDGTGYPDHLCG